MAAASGAEVREAPSRLDDGPIEDVLQELYVRLRCVPDGAVATYIPELATARPERFGLSIATLDGHVYGAGDCGVPFTIQSVSKPFVYALALADRGTDAVLDRIGVEPTGDSFNSITVDEVTGRPFNPMVNAGAIVTTSLVGGDERERQFDRIREGLSVFAGRDLDVDARVLRPSGRRVTATARSPISCGPSAFSTRTSTRCSTCTSGSAPSWSPVAIWR